MKKTVRHRLALGIAIVAPIAIVTIGALVVHRWGGPVKTGALTLLIDPPADPHPHPLPDDYTAFHHGGIDLSSGLYTHTDEDLVIRGPVPLALRRQYLSEDRRSRAFGIGASHDGESFVVGDREGFQYISIVLGSGSQLRFERISPGHSFDDAVLEHTETPSGYYGALLGWVGNSWAVRLQDGEFLEFERCWGPKPRPCGLVRSRDRDGHVLRLERDGDGLLQRMSTGDEWMAFEYDKQYRVTRALTSDHHETRYSYDERGRLARVVPDQGFTRAYTYTDRDQMATLVEPDIAIENQYDANGRCIRQIDRFPGGAVPLVFEFEYHMQGDRIVQADDRRSDGWWRRVVFNTSRYSTSVELGRRERSFATVRLRRDPESNVVQEVVVTCPDRRGQPAEHARLVSPGEEERVEDELFGQYCGMAAMARIR